MLKWRSGRHRRREGAVGGGASKCNDVGGRKEWPSLNGEGVAIDHLPLEAFVPFCTSCHGQEAWLPRAHSLRGAAK